MILKNKKQREEFLDNYSSDAQGWYLWKEDDDIDRRMYRRDISCSRDGEELQAAIIVEEEQHSLIWPKPRVVWSARRWFKIDSWTAPFADQRVSKTQLVAFLAEIKEFE